MYNYRLTVLFHMQEVLLKIDENLQSATVTVYPFTSKFSSYKHWTSLLQVWLAAALTQATRTWAEQPLWPSRLWIKVWSARPSSQSPLDLSRSALPSRGMDMWVSISPAFSKCTCHLSLMSAERYSSIWYSTVHSWTVRIDLACVSAANLTLSWWAGFMPDAYVWCCISAL